MKTKTDNILPARYTEKSRSEAKSINILKSILSEKKIVCDNIKENDKTPNHDGYIELIDEKGFQLGVIFISVKTLNPRYRKKPQCFINLSTLAFARSWSVPFVYIVVDQDNKIAYWRLLDRDFIENVYVNKASKIKVKKSIQIIFEKDEIITEDNQIYYNEWKTILEKFKGQIDGIIHIFADNKDLNKSFLSILKKMHEGEYKTAIDEINTLLRVLTLTPIQRASLMGNESSCLFNILQYDKAASTCQMALDLIKNEKITNRKHIQIVLFSNLGKIYTLKGKFDQAEIYINKVIEMDKDLKDQVRLADDILDLGFLYYKKHEFKIALEKYSDALSISETVGNIRNLASVKYRQGELLIDNNELSKANEILLDALEKSRKIKHRNLEMVITTTLGDLEMKRGNLDQSLVYHDQALNAAHILKDKIHESGILHNKSLNLMSCRNFSEAIDIQKETIGACVALENFQGEATTRMNCATCYRELGRDDEAINELDRALDIFEKLNDKEKCAMIKGELGIILLKKKEFDKAKDFFQESLDYAKNINNISSICSNLMHLGILFETRGDFIQAVGHYNQAKDILGNDGDPMLISRVLQNLASVYNKMEDFSKMVEILKASINKYQVLKDWKSVITQFKTLSSVFHKLREYSKAYDTLLDALAIAENNRIENEAMEIRVALTKCQSTHGKYF